MPVVNQFLAFLKRGCDAIYSKQKLLMFSKTEVRLQVNVFTASGVPQLPWPGVTDTILKLLLGRTVREAAVAVTGPAFATVSMQVTLLPLAAGSGESAILRERSALDVDAVSLILATNASSWLFMPPGQVRPRRELTVTF